MDGLIYTVDYKGIFVYETIIYKVIITIQLVE